ncbi:cupredoxin domain-containing protein [Pleionea litopenaei]|uniref:Plastocyanin n=1 Tax=Pleionea litopenaei TaxID=3070815 RepID=A0AA51RVG2_9GAMM|nr:hypothetical protein [Pleionea sp. HL-JVS1]WMS88317.1 hypothetical protein Q9312_05210 [Pleionea sp. HL-JVS1]
MLIKIKIASVFVLLTTSLISSASELKGQLTLADSVKVDVGVIYLKPESFSPKSLIIDQTQRIFHEPVYVTQPGSKVTIKNSDRSRHNVFINNLQTDFKLNTGILRRNESREYQVDWPTEHIARVGCFIHSTMISYVISIPSNEYDALVFNNNNPKVPFKVAPVDYPFSIEYAKKPEVIYLALPYRNVDPIDYSKGVHKITEEGREIGTITFF